MKVKNRAKGLELDGVEYCASFTKLTKGLMGKKQGKALLHFKKEGIFGIWMLFMRFPIDIAFISKDREIITIGRNLKPISLNLNTWKIYYPTKKAQYVLEVEQGGLSKFEIGDKLEFIF